MRESESEVAQSCPTRSNPMDCSPPGSSVRRIFQARVLEWVAIAFSGFHVKFSISPRVNFGCILEQRGGCGTNPPHN